MFSLSPCETQTRSQFFGLSHLQSVLQHIYRPSMECSPTYHGGKFSSLSIGGAVCLFVLRENSNLLARRSKRPELGLVLGPAGWVQG